MKIELRKRLIDGFKQRWAYIEQLKQATSCEDWGKVSRLASELATLDVAIKYANETLETK